VAGDPTAPGKVERASIAGKSYTTHARLTVLPIEDVPSDIFLQLNTDALLKTIDSIYVHSPTLAKILDVSYDQQVKTFESLDNVGPLRTHTLG
jgi:hypothetical protein